MFLQGNPPLLIRSIGEQAEIVKHPIADANVPGEEITMRPIPIPQVQAADRMQSLQFHNDLRVVVCGESTPEVVDACSVTTESQVFILCSAASFSKA